MLPPGAEAPDCCLDMQLTGKVVLSAAALLLVTAAYRLYRSRPAQAPPGGGYAKAEGGEEAEGSRPLATQKASPEALQRGLRRRRASQEARALQDCSRETSGASSDLATAATSRDGEPKRRSSHEEEAQQCPDSEQVPPPCGGQEVRAVLGGKPDPPHHSYLDSEPKNSPSGLAAMGISLAPWQHCRPPEESVMEQSGFPHQHWLTHQEGSSDMNKSWVFTHMSGVHREGAGALQAASDMDLALHQQEGATNACYTFSSTARVRAEENFIQEKVAGSRPRLKGKVYEYYVQSDSQAVSRGRLASKTSALAEAPSSMPGLPDTRAALRGHDNDKEGETETPAPSQPRLPTATTGFSRKQSLLHIVENPELQLQLGGFEMPASPSPEQDAPTNGPPFPDSSSAVSSMEESRVQFVAGTNFFRLPLSPSSTPDVHLDLANCYEVLTLAKKQKLEALKEAAYKVMSDNYLQVLRSPDIYDRLSGGERELILRRRLRGRQYLVVLDVCPQEDSGSLCCYDDEQDAWHPLARLPPEAVSRGCALCSLFNYLFVVSGCQGPGLQPSNRVFCYNPLTGIWSEVCGLSQARPHCRLVALDGYLYAIGGECLNTVERYDPRLDRWDFTPPLPNDTFALAHTATACAGELFVTGGTLRYLLLRFSAQEQRWWAGPTGGGRDRTVEMVAVNGFLYRFDLNRSLGISVYRCSASTRLWYECATYRMPYPAAFQCAVVDNHIYCVGRQHTLGFLADHISPRFVPKELQSFPSPRGTLLPTVLTLPTPSVPQTRV
ncbi:PREDICTED: kelch domain-containing protein 7A [Chrysochloris asiatica]|uniref:Kelch domain-containing protein 7A n=1 Tax=Chrysochloris asiatica TaxID=185453 RepID=A0A9B0TL88_CHRAS|nr:PREDICTED: kelch domain-containing protein 7A [Chrysochloris asiatica]